MLLLTYLVEKPLTTAQPTTTSRQSTTRTAGANTVFVRSTYVVATNVNAATLQRDLTSVIAVALTQAGVPVTLPDVVVVVEGMPRTRRSNNWRATVFVNVAEQQARATMSALQKFQQDNTIQNELRVCSRLRA